MKIFAGVVATVWCVIALAQPAPPPLTVASMVLSVVRIALNLGSGRQEYVQVDVVAEGATVDQARLEGFRVAVNQAVGSVVATQTQTQNQRLTRDEIINYSSGFVDRFEILEQQDQGNRVRLKMRVWVAESRIAHRLLGQSYDSQSVPGGRIGAQVETLLEERHQGDRLIQAVMADYPHRAFDVQVGKSRVKFDDYRRASIVTDVTIQWDLRFAEAVRTTLQKTQDPAKHAWVYQQAVGQEPTIQLSAVDSHGRILHKECLAFTVSPNNTGFHRPPRYLLLWHRDSVHFDTGYRVGGNLTLNFGQDTERLKQVDRIQVKILPQKDC
ncbi:hypothetical protein UFOVP328_410 [uncultured Caudovirales phage]|uniref:Uncharacterized protein n=1 Tax=uncultured Caudovirales phage TaxID=2100421 RepID=A0A6J5LYS9_9CAUD|nr:hypothetical protein UFOVP328_410 [uncultured Caudovirales phage]